MSGIIPVPTTRISNILVYQTLLGQLQADQTDLLNIQNQISTGQRIAFPSEDAPAALRAVGLKSLVDRKNQAKTNLQTNTAYLSTTDTALSSVSNLIASARGTIVAVNNANTTDAQRSAALSQLNNTIQQLVNIGNQQYNGRYLFAGSKLGQPPFETVGDFVRYNGNEQQLNSFADLNQLFATNVTGNQAFGALSTQVQGSVDLNPTLTRDTKLADLQGGAGIAKGSIAISDGTSTSIVDLSHADTLGDVVDAIERSPPAGRTITIDLSGTGLNVSIDGAGGGDLAVTDVGSGTTARDLGILRVGNAGTTPITGSDLNPSLTLATQLSGILGTRSVAKLPSSGSNNDLLIEANHNGAQFDGLQVNFIDDGTVAAGNEQISYNPVGKTLTVKIQTGASTANQVIAALAANAAFSADYTAKLNSHEANNSGGGGVAAGLSASTNGGTGADLDQNAGLQIVNGGQTYRIDLSQARTVEDVLNALNGSGASVLAEINAAGNGIDVRSRLSGADFSIGENGGQAASQLGLRRFNLNTSLDDLNQGLGVHKLGEPDFSIQRKDGSLLQIDLSSAKTIGDVLNLINNATNNQSPQNRVTARLNATGNGIELTVASAGGSAPLSVTRLNGSQAAEDLGLIPVGASSSVAAVSSGGTDTLDGRDVNPQQVVGLFTALIRAKQAIATNNLPQLQQSVTTLDAATINLRLSQSELGVRQQNVADLQTQLTNDVTNLTDQVSQEIDTDLPSAISNLTARQTSLQAALKLAAQTSQLTLLNYL